MLTPPTSLNLSSEPLTHERVTNFRSASVRRIYRGSHEMVAYNTSGARARSGIHAGLGRDLGCYDPKPGHPTLAEKQQFITEISALAVEAKRKHGILAAAIAAMSMVESGYRW